MKTTLSKKSYKTMKFDWILFIFTIVVSAFGLLMVYSATLSFETNSNITVQSVAWALGTGGLFFFCFFDYEQFLNMIKYIVCICIALLLGVLVIGITGNWGARSWIRIGSIGIQPSELVKIGFILTFSYHLSKVSKTLNNIKTILFLILHISVPVFLILMQPDAGSAMVFIFMFICMIFSAKLSYKYIIPFAGIFLLSIPFVYNFVLDEFQKHRIQVFLNPELDPINRGYNVIQSKIAIGSGGVFGKGFTKGTQNMMEYLPSKHTDFIFSVIAEEFGFIGAVLTILTLFAIILRCFSVAKKSHNLFGRFICIGVGSMLLFHTFENIGMCMGVMPVTGIPLPFISYGGTSLVTNLVSIGLVMSVSYHNKPRNIYEVY